MDRYGYWNKILHVILGDRSTWIEEPGDGFFRRYAGGRGLIAHYLLEYVPTGADPLGPDNILVIAPGVITGAPVPGAGRHSVGAKSPLTGGFGESESGGYWGAELKRAGWDAIVFHGVSPLPSTSGSTTAPSSSATPRISGGRSPARWRTRSSPSWATRASASHRSDPRERTSSASPASPTTSTRWRAAQGWAPSWGPSGSRPSRSAGRSRSRSPTRRGSRRSPSGSRARWTRSTAPFTSSAPAPPCRARASRAGCPC